MAARCKPLAWFAAPLVCLTLAVPVQAEPEQLNTIKDVVLAIHRCWRPPPAEKAGPIDITVIVSFNREGAILGHPRISYESQEATDNDRIAYRIAVMETLQRCTPLPFTESLGGAVAGRPFAIPFRNKKYPPRSQEKRAWLLPKIL
ncbi:hypothetical protein GPL21_18575 [Bradyrhizobium pachyrhizi]|uniref:TonB C-terminal domain-containing protein n=1 Tax=Bradyrhizobium pachyrhizi TaxID=280333 RepID=A0A844SJE1_9BRAD|nr:hypothetical protein [Bradyrhizobium pachyrhizi]MVT67108.1 hypothetical protein [Bradyrhizobium pachyrhizi]WFU52438.1 hypothetical protein QA639_22285 [Bradyrhizobium pachyrhizi]